MARVTVEDCMQVVKNRFELVILAAQRAKDIASGSLLTLERDNDKNAVVALREIASKNIKTEALLDIVLRNLQKKGRFDVIDETLEDKVENEDEVSVEFFDNMPKIVDDSAIEDGYDFLSETDLDSDQKD